MALCCSCFLPKSFSHHHNFSFNTIACIIISVFDTLGKNGVGYC